MPVPYFLCYNQNIMENINSFNIPPRVITNERIHDEHERDKAKSIEKRNRRLGDSAIENAKAEQEFGQVEFQLNRAESLINRYKEDYYIAGAEKNLQEGHLEIFSPSDIAVGFQAVDGREFDRAFTTEHDKYLFDNALKRETTNKIMRFENRSNLLALEHEAAMNAIVEGAYTEHDNPTEPIFNLPMDKPGLRSALEARGVDFGNRDTRTSSINGFINIIEATKFRQEKFPAEDTIIGENVPLSDLVGDRFKEANWYFDNFGYGKDQDSMDEFIGKINEYAEKSDKTWSDTANDFLATRPEYAEYLEKANTTGREKAYEAISKAEELSFAEFKAKLDELGLKPTPETIFPDTGKGPERRRGQDPRPPRNLVPGAVKRQVFLGNAERITNLRDDANLYFGSFKDGNRTECYGVIRFGYRGHNVAIAESLTDTIGACYVFCGKTGDDREGWRVPFSASKAYAREQDAIKVFNHDQRKSLDGQAITATTKTEAMWQRIWDYLNSLPA